MPSITVKYLPRTDTRGPRFVATANNGAKATVETTQYDSMGDAEREAVRRCIAKNDWLTENATWHRSGMPQHTGFVAVYVWPNDTYDNALNRK